MISQTIDFDTLVRSMLDTCTAGDRAADVAARAFTTSCWMAKRGVVITLDGEPFSPGNLSPQRAARLIENRGLFEDEDAS